MRDLTGQRFGRLVALEVFGKNKYGNIVWLCKCECGNVIDRDDQAALNLKRYGELALEKSVA